MYAWGVTVAPVGFGGHGPRGTQNWPAMIFATLAFVALVRGAVSEAMHKDDFARVATSRALTLFTFAAASLITWVCDTDALSPVRLSAARGIAGMVGWALFAYASSAPVVEPVAVPARIEAGGRARGRVEKGDAIFVGVVAILALGLQIIGWNVQMPERALLVRLTTLGAGVLLLGGAGAYVSARHGARLESPRREPNLRARVRSTRSPIPLGWVIALVLLLAGGLLYVLTD